MITYRLEKAEPLSVLEIDNNFRELEQRIKTLEGHATPTKLTIEQQEDVLIFKTNAETISHVVLPKFQPIFKGAWKQLTSYHIGCWVTTDQKLYACQSPHTSTQEFEPNFWQLIFEGGNNA